MIPHALVSCSFLLLGSGNCVYRLLEYSSEKYSTLLPQFVVASVGIASTAGRSLHALIYNIFWRSYPIDPRLIADELRQSDDDTNFADWTLRKIGVACLVHSFYALYGFTTTGTLIVLVGMVIEASCRRGKVSDVDEINLEESTRVRNVTRRLSAIATKFPYPVSMFWILSSELFGRAMGNNYCRLANVPLAIATWAFPSRGFHKGWSIIDAINDYAMLCYIILMTEGLLRNPIPD